MKKITLTFLLAACLWITALAQLPEGYNHYQTYGGGWEYVNGNTFRFKGSHQNERVMYDFDLATKTYKYLTDSLEKNNTRYYLNGDTGYMVSSNTSNNFYTYDGFETTTPVAQGYMFLKVLKTKSGYLAYTKVSSKYYVYYSTDLQSWTEVTNITVPGAIPFNLLFIQNNIYIINKCNNYLYSNDGGTTFKLVNTSSSATDYFTELLAMDDSLHILARNGANDWLLTNDGGKTWSKYPMLGGYNFLYAQTLDSIYFTSELLGKRDTLYLSTDTCRTLQAYADSLDSRLVNKKVEKMGDYYIGNNTAELLYSDNLLRGWKSLPLYQNGRNCIDMKGNFGLTGGEGGKYSYSHDGGLTFENSTITGAKDIMACKIINDSLFLVSDRNSSIYKSTDGGITWTKQYNSTQSSLIGRRFVHNKDFSVIVLFRTVAGALVSTDYGDSWKTLTGQAGVLGSITPSGKILVAQELYDASTGTLIIYQTVEEIDPAGNRTVVKKFAEKDLAQMGLIMYNDDEGYYFAAKKGTDEMQVFKTTDGWATYNYQGTAKGIVQQPFMTGYQTNYFVPGKDTIYVHLRHTSSGNSLSNRLIFYSYDGGATWAQQEITTNRYNSPDKMTAIHFFDSKHYISTWTLGRMYLNTVLKDNGTNPGGGTNPPTAIHTLAQNNSALVYPNPFTDQLNIESKTEIEKAEIYNLTGKRVWAQNTQGTKLNLVLPQLDENIYFLVLYTQNGKQVHKLVKTKQ